MKEDQEALAEALELLFAVLADGASQSNLRHRIVEFLKRETRPVAQQEVKHGL